MAETIGPAAVEARATEPATVEMERNLLRPERNAARSKGVKRHIGRKAIAGLALVGSFFVQQNQAVIRDLLPLPFDKEDAVVFAVEGINEPDHIRRLPTDDVAKQVASDGSATDITDKDGSFLSGLKNYFDYSMSSAQPLEYIRFLHNFENYPQIETTSDKTGIVYTVYSDVAEPLWQNYTSDTFEDDLVSAIEYSLEPHSYENSRVQFIQDKLAESTITQQERTGEHKRVFIPSKPSCLNSGVPISLLDDPGLDCDALGAAPRDMSIRWLPFYNTTGFDDVIVLTTGDPTRVNVNTRFEHLATHEGIHRIHFSYGYENKPHDQNAIEKNVKYIEYEIFDSSHGDRNYDHRPINTTEPLIDIAQLYADYIDNTTTTATD